MVCGIPASLSNQYAMYHLLKLYNVYNIYIHAYNTPKVLYIYMLLYTTIIYYQYISAVFDLQATLLI